MNNENKTNTNISELNDSKPFLFTKKINNNNLPGTLTPNDVGKSRHFPPATQEWSNSVYTYNTNYVKLLPRADKSLMSLLKSYFNFYYNSTFLKTKHNPLVLRSKRLSANRIFVGKGNIKHTSNKVIITWYVHNVEKLYLMKKLKLIYKNLFYPRLALKKSVKFDLKTNKQVIGNNRSLTLKEYLSLPVHLTDYISFILILVNKINVYLNIVMKYNNVLNNMVEVKEISKEEKYTILRNKIKDVSNLKYPDYAYYENQLRFNFLKELLYYRYLLRLNKIKFDETFMFKLKCLIAKIYNKEVEFNIVNLKKIHSNSDIFTQAVTLKVKNRKNRLLNVLKSSLSKVKLDQTKKYEDKDYKLINKELNVANIVKNNNINSMFNNNNLTHKDPLNSLLLNIFPLADNMQTVVKDPISIQNYVLKSLKNNNLAGVRLEAKGRLTRRFTASRSLFKVKWKGSLSNINSSYRGLSAVMLRGHVKTNIQYSVLNSKTRNGAFGIKGWVSNR